MLWLVATLLLVAGLGWLGRRFHAPPPHEEPPPLEPLPDDLPAVVAVEDSLDLHGVPPREVAELVDAFLDNACLQGRRQVRIVHGKGIGAMRRTVRDRLARHPGVLAFADAPPPSGWGATVVELAPPAVAPPQGSD